MKSGCVSDSTRAAGRRLAEAYQTALANFGSQARQPSPCASPAFPFWQEQVARTAGFAVRVFSVAIMSTALYGRAVSQLRRPFVRIDPSSSQCACPRRTREETRTAKAAVRATPPVTHSASTFAAL
jgi:hypothetical protein